MQLMQARVQKSIMITSPRLLARVKGSALAQAVIATSSGAGLSPRELYFVHLESISSTSAAGVVSSTAAPAPSVVGPDI